MHMNVQNMLLMLRSLVCSLTVQLALGAALMLRYLCNNIGLVLACILSGSTYVIITQPSGIPTFSPVLCWSSLYPPFFTILTVIVFLSSLKGICIPSSIFIGCCVSELHDVLITMCGVRLFIVVLQ